MAIIIFPFKTTLTVSPSISPLSYKLITTLSVLKKTLLIISVFLISTSVAVFVGTISGVVFIGIGVVLSTAFFSGSGTGGAFAIAGSFSVTTLFISDFGCAFFTAAVVALVVSCLGLASVRGIGFFSLIGVGIVAISLFFGGTAGFSFSADILALVLTASFGDESAGGVSFIITGDVVISFSFT